MTTFFGRYKYYLKVTNPMRSFNKQNTIEDYKVKVKELEGQGKLSAAAVAELDLMKITLASSINPDT